MNHVQILKQAWHTLVNYRTLWILGVLLALTTFAGPGTTLIDRDDQPDGDWKGVEIVRREDETFRQAFTRTMDAEFAQVDQQLEAFFATELGIDINSSIKTYLIILLGIALVLFLIGRVVRYVSETAIIQLVDRFEETGEKVRFWYGIRRGWSLTSWRLFLIDLVITVVAASCGISLFALILGPIALWMNKSDPIVLIGSLLTASLFILAVLAVIVFTGFVSLWRFLARRACALDGMTVFGSIRQGIRMMRGNLKDVIGMGLITVGIGSFWALILGLSVLLLLGTGLFVGTLPIAILTTFSHSTTWPILLVSSLLILIAVSPLVLLEGMARVYISTLWTLSYRQLRVTEKQSPKPAPITPGASLQQALSSR